MRVYTLGRFRVEIAGAPLRSGSKPQRKPLELLKVLVALGGESVAAEQIAESLWPDAEADHAYSALTTTLSRLRKRIGHGSLRLQDGRPTLESAPTPPGGTCLLGMKRGITRRA
ncbi:MAG: winged helix-turn-helix domain-containing protein [SAR324 cluster bacterium]|nr:winged helix-turn-helix domain-containing protein [SAR324 cluster bacterium]